LFAVSHGQVPVIHVPRRKQLEAKEASLLFNA